MKKLVIFDFDGTIADTSPGIRHCYNATAAAMGYTPHPEREDFYGIIGGSLEHGFAKLWPQMRQEEIQQAVTEYRGRYASQGIALPAPLYPGMKETLEALKAKGFYLAIATLKHKRFIGRMLEDLKINRLFDAVCAYQNGETKQDLLEEACHLAGAAPKESLLVGDSTFDGQGAQACGMEFAAALYGWGFRGEEDTAPYHPVACLRQPQDLAAVLGLPPLHTQSEVRSGC